LERDKIGGLKPERIESEIGRTQFLLSELNSFLKQEAGPWLFGRDQPTALDAHLVVFIARLQDLGRESLIPPALIKYAGAAMEKPEWQSTMAGRRTMISRE
jgi:glutathione S-transferase